MVVHIRRVQHILAHLHTWDYSGVQVGYDMYKYRIVSVDYNIATYSNYTESLPQVDLVHVYQYRSCTPL